MFELAECLEKMNHIDKALDELNAGRRRAAEWYRRELPGVKGVVLPPADQEGQTESVYHMFVIRLDNHDIRESLAKALKEQGVSDADLAKVYVCDDLAKGNRILFAATGISDSTMLRGIRYEDTAAVTTSILMRAKYQTVRYIRTVHNLDLKTVHLRSDASDHAL